MGCCCKLDYLRPGTCSYANQYLVKPDTNPISYKPKNTYVKPTGVYNEPTIYQRSYLPVKAQVDIVGPPISIWSRPTDKIDSPSSYQVDYCHWRHKRIKWIHHCKKHPKKPEERISEYDDKYRLLAKKQFDKATNIPNVPTKISAKRSAGFSRLEIKPPMFLTSTYQAAYKVFKVKKMDPNVCCVHL